jgi:glucose/arabinose dehydrogenase
MRSHIRRHGAAVLVVLALALAAGQALAQLTSELVSDGFDLPTFVTSPPGETDRLFVLEQNGLIRIISGGSILPTPFLDLDALIPDVSGNDERGLLGLAFHPDYADNGFFYVNYIDLDNNTVIARYSVSSDPDVADPGSEAVILPVDQPANNHNGGMLAFSRQDGYLYIGLGDGGGAGDPLGNGQNTSVLLGKILRIDVDSGSPYAIPPDNPFVGVPGAQEEIWAYGLRNPYRFSFDRQNGDLYIGDVGQSSYEEIDYQPASSGGGEDYGWNIMEGLHCYNPPTGCDETGLVLPIHEYDHSGPKCSVTGGYVYRGAAIPDLVGTYFFADFCSDQIWSFHAVSGAVTHLQERTAELTPESGDPITNISSFGEDGAGELYIVQRDGVGGGAVFRIIRKATDAPGELPPSGGSILHQNEPNPFNPATEIAFTVRRGGAQVRLDVLDLEGSVVATLVHGKRPEGRQSVTWRGRDAQGHPVPSGVYLYRLQAGADEQTRKMLLLR